MNSPLQALIQTGTKLWLDSVDPELIETNRQLRRSGATSNPIIIADLLKSGRFDSQLQRFVEQGLSDSEIAWQMTDLLVRQAQDAFLPAWERSGGDDGYVSFEVDPLLEDPELGPDHEQRVDQYIELGKHWSAGHQNRMIKVPATPAGLASLEELVAAGVTLNVTLIFTMGQYHAARDAVCGAQRRSDLNHFKSVYSIFVSRIDVYTEKHVSQLSAAAQGQVGIVNAKQIWANNREFWQDKSCPLAQEMIFASTGTKNPADPSWKYVAALAGSDIQTNPPATNEAVAQSGLSFTRQVDQLPGDEVLSEIQQQVDFAKLEETLMDEGIKKFADPQKALIASIGEKRLALSSS